MKVINRGVPTHEALDHLSSIVGCRIIAITNTSDYDGQNEGSWGLHLDNGDILWIDRDAEQNGPGWAVIQKKGD